MARQFGLLSSKFGGIFETLRDACTGLVGYFIQFGVGAGQYVTGQPGVCKYAYLQSCTDLALKPGIRMRVIDVGVYGSYWNSTGAASGVLWVPEPFYVNGSPAGVITAPPGSIVMNIAGGAATTLYVKESGTGNTGWVAK